MGQPISRQPPVQILLLGLDNAGKSTLLYKLKRNISVSTVPTIGFNVEMLEARINRRNISATLWDVGGQGRMREHWQDYYQNVSAVMFVVDSSDLGRMDEARGEMEKAMLSDHLRDCPIVLVANKQDVSGALTVTEIKEKFKMKKTYASRDWLVQPCSASTGFGVEKAFRRAIQMARLPSQAGAVKDNIKNTVHYL